VKAEELRHKAVQYEKQGKPLLAKQSCVSSCRSTRSRLRVDALANMEYTLEQVQVKRQLR